METRLYYIGVPEDNESIAELSVVALVRGVYVSPSGYIPGGARGTVVSVYSGGAAYEVEFAEPMHALLTLKADQIRAVPELTRDHIITSAKSI